MNERGQYGTVSRRLSRDRERYGDRLIGADPGPIEPRYAARRRAVKAIFYFHDRVRSPLYVYAEVNGVSDVSPAGSQDEARSRLSALRQSPAEVYAAIFDVTDASWPDPALETYHAASMDRGVTAGWVGATPADGHSYGDVFKGQLATYSHSRGVDHAKAPPITIPRTTIADVSELIDYWNGALAQVTGFDADVREVMGIPVENLLDKPGELGGMKHAVRAWRGQAWIARKFIAAGPPSAVYVFNAQLWNAMQTLSTELAVYQAAPSKWDLIVESTETAAKNLYEKGKEAVKEAWGVGKYLLIGASVIGGGIVLSRVLGK